MQCVASHSEMLRNAMWSMDELLPVVQFVMVSAGNEQC